MNKNGKDRAIDIRQGENLDKNKLTEFLKGLFGNSSSELIVKQFPSGFSNLTYLVKWGNDEFVLRKPPIGAKIKSAHDMHREFKVLSLLLPLYDKIPRPVTYCEDLNVLGSPFYLMERVEGVIIRSQIPKGIDFKPDDFKKLSERTIDNLVELHNLELNDSKLISLGKPKGYVDRQVNGWIKRYKVATTDIISNMNLAEEWLISNIPSSTDISFLHNDYKYDNLLLDFETKKIKAVLDWEMSTVGHPLMDLGAMLSYWVEADESPALNPFNLTWADGNLSREEVAFRYSEARNIDINDILFYYVFGCYKLGVIVQQIYSRYKSGLTKDPRFKNLIYVTQACANNAANAIKYKRINNFH